MAALRASQAERPPPWFCFRLCLFFGLCEWGGRIWGNTLPCRPGLGEKEWPIPSWIRASGRTRIQLSRFPASRLNHRTAFLGFCFGRATPRPGAESSDERRCPPGWPVRRLPRKSGAAWLRYAQRRPSAPQALLQRRKKLWEKGNENRRAVQSPPPAGSGPSRAPRLPRPRRIRPPHAQRLLSHRVAGPRGIQENRFWGRPGGFCGDPSFRVKWRRGSRPRMTPASRSLGASEAAAFHSLSWRRGPGLLSG